MTWQGVSEAECYDNRSVIAQIVRIKDRLTAVEQNVDPTLRTDLEAAVADLEALETTVSGIGTQVEANTGSIGDLEDDLGAFETATNAALALKADTADVDADLDLKADKTQLTDGSVTKIGTSNVGSSTKFIYLSGGVPTAGDTVALLSKSGQVFTAGIDFKGGVCFGTEKTKDIVASDLGKWMELVRANTANLGEGVSATIFASVCCNNTLSPNGERVVTSTIDYMMDTGDLIQSPAATSVYHRPGGELEIAVTSTGDRVIVYAKIPTYATTSNNSNRMKMAITHMAGHSNGTGTVLLENVTTMYDDVIYDGKHIPNITNYTSYQWATLTAGHGVNGDYPRDQPTQISFRSF